MAWRRAREGACTSSPQFCAVHQPRSLSRLRLDPRACGCSGLTVTIACVCVHVMQNKQFRNFDRLFEDNPSYVYGMVHGVVNQLLVSCSLTTWSHHAFSVDSVGRLNRSNLRPKPFRWPWNLGEFFMPRASCLVPRGRMCSLGSDHVMYKKVPSLQAHSLLHEV